MKFDLLNSSINFSEDIVRYNSMRRIFEARGSAARQKFIDLYKTRYKSIDDVCKYAYDDGFRIVVEEISCIVNELISDGIYNIDEKTFFENYCEDYIQWEEVFEEINEKYQKIILSDKEMDSYRVSRRQSRGKWRGGGFGVGGAIKGAATAGAMNMVGGITHMGFNALGKIGSSISVSNKKDKLFKDPETLETLAEGIDLDVFALHLALRDFKISDLDIDIGCFYKEDLDESNIFLNNVKERDLTETVKVELLLKALATHPYNFEVYKYIFEVYGDENSEVQKIADYFGYDMSYLKPNSEHDNIEKLEVETLQDNKNCCSPASNLTNVSDVEKANIISSKLSEYGNKNAVFEILTSNDSEVDKITQIIELTAFNDIIKSSSFKNSVHSGASSVKSLKKKEVAKALNIYKDATNNGELFLYVYDDTNFLTQKEGLLLTDKGIHVNNKNLKTFIDYNEVQTIENKQVGIKDCIEINHTYIVSVNGMNFKSKQFGTDIAKFVDIMKIYKGID